MSSGLSPDNEQFIQQAVELGTFHSREEALDQAVELLRKRAALLRHIDEGTRQLREGEYTDYDEDGLREFFDEIQAEGMKRYEARKVEEDNQRDMLKHNLPTHPTSPNSNARP